MGLHHFFWNGREQTVAIFKSADRLTLTFFDKEIESSGLQKISFTQDQPFSQQLGQYKEEQQKRIRELLDAIQEKVPLEPSPAASNQ
jgi:hypothetical protein